jgi:hypothetical protein
MDSVSGVTPEQRVETIDKWIREFVIRPHTDLGRDGIVCPFMSTTMRRKLLDVQTFDLSNGEEKASEFVIQSMEELTRRAAGFGGDRTYVTSVLIPYGLPDEEMAAALARLHAALKPEFVSRGLMLGEFWPRHAGPGLHNPEFRPSAAPVPMFVIRHMVPTDVGFLGAEEIPPADRLDYLAQYRRVLGARLTGHWAERLAAAEASARYELRSNN